MRVTWDLKFNLGCLCDLHGQYHGIALALVPCLVKARLETCVEWTSFLDFVDVTSRRSITWNPFWGAPPHANENWPCCVTARCGKYFQLQVLVAAATFENAARVLTQNALRAYGFGMSNRMSKEQLWSYLALEDRFFGFKKFLLHPLPKMIPKPVSPQSWGCQEQQEQLPGCHDPWVLTPQNLVCCLTILHPKIFPNSGRNSPNLPVSHSEQLSHWGFLDINKARVLWCQVESDEWWVVIGFPNICRSCCMVLFDSPTPIV